MNCIVFVCEGSKGVGVWFGTPSTYRMSGLRLAWHWQFICEHAHSMSHYGIVCWLVMSEWRGVPHCCGELFLCLLDTGVGTLIVNEATCLCHFCGIMYSWGLGILGAKRCFFVWLPIYWAYLNFSVWVIWTSVTFLFFHNWLESFWFIRSLASHFSTYGNLCWAIAISRLSWSFIMNLCMFLMASLCVVVGQLASQYGVAWAMWIWGVSVGCSFSVLSLASMSTSSFFLMLVWARTLWMWIKCGV